MMPAVAGARFGGDRVHVLASTVGGAIIDGDDLKSKAGRFKKRAQALLDCGFFVAGGDDDG